jgi:hypothetical protein
MGSSSIDRSFVNLIVSPSLNDRLQVAVAGAVVGGDAWCVLVLKKVFQLNGNT